MKDEMEPPAFDLRVRTKEFALRIVRMFVALPKTEVARVLGKQALRSGTSIGANFREAHRARSKAENLSPRLATVSRSWTKQATGWNFSWNPISFLPPNFPSSKTNANNFLPF